MTLPKSFGLARNWPAAPGRPLPIGAPPILAVPAAPTIALTASNGQVSLAWTDGYNGGAPITGHKLYRATSSGAETLVGAIATAAPYVDSGLTNGTAYFYKLSAVNALGEGAKSAEQSATPASAPAPLGLVPFANRNETPSNTTSGTGAGTSGLPYNYSHNSVTKRWNTSGVSVSNPVLLLPAFNVDASSTEYLNPTPFQVIAKIEYPIGGTRYPVTLARASPMPVPNTSWGVASDPVAGLTIPAGAAFRVHVFVQSPGGSFSGYIAGNTLTVTGAMAGSGMQQITVGTWITATAGGGTQYGAVTSVNGGGVYTLSASNTVGAAGAPVTIYFGSTFPVTSRNIMASLSDSSYTFSNQTDQTAAEPPTGTASPYSPILVGTPASAVKSYLIVGDSIALGLGEQIQAATSTAALEPATADAYGNQSGIERWLGKVDGTGRGYVNFARSSSQAAQWATAGKLTYRLQLAAQFGYTHIVNNLGRNDLWGSTTVASNNATNAAFRTGSQAVVMATGAPYTTAARPLASITASGTTATATFSSGDASDLAVGDFVVIAGATPSGYNSPLGWQVSAVSGSTFAFTVTTSGLAAATAAGTASTWTRAADQALPSGGTTETARANYNATVRSLGLGNQTGFFENSYPLETANNSGLWAATSGVQRTKDGTHPNAVGNALVATFNGSAP